MSSLADARGVIWVALAAMLAVGALGVMQPTFAGQDATAAGEPAGDAVETDVADQPSLPSESESPPVAVSAGRRATDASHLNVQGGLPAIPLSSDGGPRANAPDPPIPTDVPFGSDVDITPTAPAQLHPHSTTAPNGTIYVVYEQPTSINNNDIYVTWTEDGGLTWKGPRQVTTNTANETYPRIAILDATPDVFMVIYQSTLTNIRPYFARSTNGVAWTQLSGLAITDPGGNQVQQWFFPDIEADPLCAVLFNPIPCFQVISQIYSPFYAPSGGPEFNLLYRISITGTMIGPYWLFGFTDTFNGKGDITLTDGKMYIIQEITRSIFGTGYDVDINRCNRNWYEDTNPFDSCDLTGAVVLFFFGFLSAEPTAPAAASSGAQWLSTFVAINSSALVGPNHYIFTLNGTDGLLTLGTLTGEDGVEQRWPAVTASNGVFHVAYMRDTNVSYAFSPGGGTFTYTFSGSPFKVNDNDPATLIGGFRELTIAYGSKALLCWRDDRSGSSDIWCNGLSGYSLYVITRDPLLGQVQVNGAWSDAPAAAIWPINSTQTINTTDIEPGAPGTRYVFDFWSNGPTTTQQVFTVAATDEVLTAYYRTQYQLTMTTNAGTVTPGSVWLDAGGTYSIEAIPPAAGLCERWDWRGWLGTGLGSYPGTNNPAQITMLGPITEIARWQRQFCLYVKSPYGQPYIDPPGATPPTPMTFGWFDSGAVVFFNITSPVVAGDTRYTFQYWRDENVTLSNPANNPNFVVMSEPVTVTAVWTTEYRVTTVALEGVVSPVCPAPAGCWYPAGFVLSISAQPPAITQPGERWTFNPGWTGVGSGSYTGTVNPQTITVNGPITQTADWRHEFYVTMQANMGTTTPALPGGWYPEGTVVNIDATAPSLQYLPTQERYVFVSWTGTGSGSTSGTTKATQITVNGPITQYATWDHEYSLTMTSVPAAGTVTPASGWYDAGSQQTITAAPPANVYATGERYVWQGWTGTGAGTGEYSGSNNPATITMDAPISETATWQRQFNVTAVASVGTVTLSPPGTTSAYVYGWYNANTAITLTATAPGVTGNEQYLWSGWRYTIDSIPGQLTEMTNPWVFPLSAPIVATSTWDHEYFLTVNSAWGSPQGAGWYDAGTQAAFFVTTPWSGGPGVQYRFQTWAGDVTSSNPSETVTMNGPKSVTAIWVTQFWLTVTTPYGTPLCIGAAVDCWYDSGTSAFAGLAASPVAGTQGTQYAFVSWTGDASGTNYATSSAMTMSAPRTATANWKTQYELVCTSESPPVVTVYTQPRNIAGRDWYDSGTQGSCSLTSGAIGVGSGSRYAFVSWTGDASGTNYAASSAVTMNAPKSVSADWNLEHYIAVSANVGTVAPSSGWFVAGTTTTFVATPPGSVPGERYVFLGWTGTDTGAVPSIDVLADQPGFLTGMWEHQYQMVVEAAQGTVSPNCPATSPCWVTAGSEVTIAATPPALAYPAAEERYLFTPGWTGGGTGSYTGTETRQTVTVNTAITETAEWQREFYLDLTSAQGSPTGEGWYAAGDTADYAVEAYVPSSAGVGGVRYAFDQWTGSATSTTPLGSLPMDAPKDLTALWTTQYRVDVVSQVDTTTIGNPVGGGWYDAGDPVTISVDADDSIRTGSRQHFSGWTGSETSEQTSLVISALNGPETIVAQWVLQHQLTFTSEGASTVTIQVGSQSDATDTSFWVNDGEPIPVSAPAKEGTFEFLRFEVGGADETDNPLLLTPTGPMDIVAVYEAESTVDRDNDQLPDQWEEQYFGGTGQSANADPDDDGLTNLQEYQQGTDPLRTNRSWLELNWWLLVLIALLVAVIVLAVLLFRRRKPLEVLEEEVEEEGPAPPEEVEEEAVEEPPAKPKATPAKVEPAKPAAPVKSAVAAKPPEPKPGVKPPAPAKLPEPKPVAAPAAAPAVVTPKPAAPVAPAAPAVKTIECPGCGLIVDAGSAECPICGTALPQAKPSLSPEVQAKLKRLEEAFRAGKISPESYRENVKKLKGGAK